MQKKSILARGLCLLLLLSLLSGCSQAPGPDATPNPDFGPVTAPGAAAESAGTGEEAAPATEDDAPAEEAEGESGQEGGFSPLPEIVQLSSGVYTADTEELTAALTAEDVAQLSRFHALKRADFRGSSCQAELTAWALEHPEVELRCEVRLSDGTLLPADTKEVDLTEAPTAENLLPLVLLPELETVELGSCEDAAESNMDWEALAAAEAACPGAEFHYAFRLYKKSFDLQSTEMDLNHITMTDEGALVKKIALCMPQLSLLDMDFCEVSDEAMADIRDSLPNTEVIWRIWFGNGKRNGYSVRTDVTRILASNPDKAGELTPENTRALKYCTRVKYLDLGHNDQMTDISFVRYMPDLEVAVLAMGGFSDLSPLADCPKLEYLEIQTSAASDLRPLAGLTNLRHLNIAYIFSLTDITPLYNLTNLERLWIGAYDPVPMDQIEEMQRRAPNCEIDYTTTNPTGGNWRYVGTDKEGHGILHPRYALLHEQFEYGRAPYCYSYLANDPLYYPHK
ncbi:MAG: hypothetical protein IJK63_03855 [Oscillospiraceae bacterium]|nr:hypothetical protein [Oscillospiraceae bacterium]